MAGRRFDEKQHWENRGYQLRFSAVAPYRIGVALILIVAMLLRRAASEHIADSVERYRARKAILLLAYVAGISLIAGFFSQRLATLDVSLGVAAAGVAVALQDVITSIAGWAVISTGSIYRPGDRTQLAGVSSDVIDIGVLQATRMEIGQWVKSDLYNGRIDPCPEQCNFQRGGVQLFGGFPFCVG